MWLWTFADAAAHFEAQAPPHKEYFMIKYNYMTYQGSIDEGSLEAKNTSKHFLVQIPARLVPNVGVARNQKKQMKIQVSLPCCNDLSVIMYPKFAT